MMRFVLRAHAVAQDLDRLAVLDRPVQQPGDPRLDARHQCVAAAREVRTRTGAVAMYLVAAGLGVEDGRAFQARTRQSSEEHTSELQSPMRISYAVFRLQKQKK